MNSSFVRSLLRYSIWLFALVITANESNAQTVTSLSPRYRLSLTQQEFFILNQVLENRVAKEDNDIDLYWKVTKEDGKTTWIVGVNDAKTLEDIRKWNTGSPIMNAGYTGADSASYATVSSSLSEKIGIALQNPYWKQVRLTGSIIQKGSRWYLRGGEGMFALKNGYPPELKNTGRPVIIYGYADSNDELEVVRYSLVPVNTIELAVMSQCPYGRNAEIALINFIDSYKGNDKPVLKLRYIFYKMDQGKSNDYTSLHGPEEVKENVVQIIIRDHYPDFFINYLKQRFYSTAAWEILAQHTGMNETQVRDIKNRLDKDSITIIQTEYAYLTNEYAIYDGSPTFIWEGRKLNELQDIPLFKEMSLSGEGCGSQ